MADLDVAVRLKFLTDGEGKLKAATKSLADFGKSASRLSGRATGRFGGDLNKAWHASVKLGGALDKSAKSAGKTATGLRAIGTGASGIDRTRASVDRLTKSTNALGAADRKVRLGAAASGGGSVLAAGALGGAMAKRKAALKEGFSEAASHVSPGAGYLVGAGGAVAVGAAVGGTVATVGAAMAYGTKQAIDFEKAMADVKKKVTLDQGESWLDVERAINKVSREMGMARTDTAALTAMAGQAGIAYKDLGAFMRLAAKAATGWDVAPKEASERLAKIKAQTQWTIPQLEEFADKVNALGDSSASAEKDIVEMFQRAAGAAKAASVPLDTSLAVTTALNSIGMQEEVAARFWNAFSSKMRTAASGGRGAKQAAEGYKMLGLTLKQVEQGMKTDATKTILDVLERLEKSSEKASAAVKIFGQEWWDEAARSGQALPEIRKNLEMLASGSWKGSLDQNLKVDLDTTANRLNRLKALVSEIGDGLMRWSLKPIGDASEKWQAAAERWERAAEADRILSKAGKDMLSAAEARRVVNDPDLRARIEAQERARTGTGESLAAYERRLRLDRPVRAPAPMISQIEGATPHIDAQQINQAAAESVAKANDLYDSLQKLNVTVRPNVDGTGAIAQMEVLKQKAQETASAMRALQNFGAPTSGTRVNPTLTGAPRGASGSTGGDGSTPATPGKQSRLGHGGAIQIGTAHFHGVKDAGAMHRQLAAFDRRIRSARDNALHDIG